ncbi:MAG: SMP-30/gluconolactonase/LRE family protein [Devosia sp.]
MKSLKAELFIDSRNALGEGPMWNPLVRRLFWFDIIGQKLFSADASGKILDQFDFDAPVSAAGVIDADTLAIAAAGGLFKLTLSTNMRELIVPIEADKPGNRSNDSRVHPSGGFWIGTMSRKGASRDGAVYQYREGRLETLITDASIPNATCFTKDGATAYFTGMSQFPGIIKKAPLDATTGRPNGPWTDFATLTKPSEPDGAVVDSEGYVWNAEWNGSRVVRYAPDGSIDREVTLPVSRPTCPCFGGDDLRTLYITSAYRTKRASAQALARNAPGSREVGDRRPDFETPPDGSQRSQWTPCVARSCASIMVALHEAGASRRVMTRSARPHSSAKPAGSSTSA